MLTRSEMIDRVTAYFRDVDRLDADATMTHLSETIVLEVPSHGVRKEGRKEVRQTYANRAETVRESWHGNFDFTVDEESGRLAVRLAVRRVTQAGETLELDNLTLVSFEGGKIAHIAIWMSGENSLN